MSLYIINLFVLGIVAGGLVIRILVILLKRENDSNNFSQQRDELVNLANEVELQLEESNRAIAHAMNRGKVKPIQNVYKEQPIDYECQRLLRRKDALHFDAKTKKPKEFFRGSIGLPREVETKTDEEEYIYYILKAVGKASSEWREGKRQGYSLEEAV